MRHQCFVYILTNKRQTALCTGVTNDLVQRVSKHRDHKTAGFTRYNVDRLVFYGEEENRVDLRCES